LAWIQGPSDARSGNPAKRIEIQDGIEKAGRSEPVCYVYRHGNISSDCLKGLSYGVSLILQSYLSKRNKVLSTVARNMRKEKTKQNKTEKKGKMPV
jgi:hypothetical protein